MTLTIQTTDLRRRVRDVLERLRRDGEPVIVRSYDRPQAVLIPYEEYEAFRAWQSRHGQRAAWLAELRAIAEEVSRRSNLSDDQAGELIAEAVRETRRL
jgi:prevent-host-death family protein